MGVRTSFTFKTSSLRRAPDNETFDDTALRGDDFDEDRELAPSVPATNYNAVQYTASSFLAAEVTDYTTVNLSWSIGTDLATELTTVPQATEIMIRYSTVGEPRTSQDGTLVTSIKPGRERYQYTHGGLATGRWTYYSLFVKYESTDDDAFYEKVASLKVQTPTDFGSTEMLWNMLPEHYRINDGSDSSTLSTASTLYGKGPLYRLLSVFGWDLDRMRTLTRYQMIAKDPDLANDEVLDALAYELGIPLSSLYLGTERLRNIVGDIGYLREFKGTLEGTREWITAITGSDVTIRPITANIIPRASVITATTSPTAAPTNASTWVVEGTGVTAASVYPGGVKITRTSGTGDLVVCAKRLITDASQAATYRTYVDLTDRSNAQLLGYLMSTTNTSGASVALTNGSISAAPAGFVYTQSYDEDDWFQAPTDLGLVGVGTYTTAPMYLHLFFKIGNGPSEITFKNLGLYTGNKYPYTIDVRPNRTNLIRDPQFHEGATYWDTTGTGSIVEYSTNRSLGASLTTNSSVTFTTLGNTPIRIGIPYYFSVHDRYNNVEECRLYSTSYGLIATALAPTASFAYADGGARKSWELLRNYEPPWFPEDVSDCYLVVIARATSGDYVEITEPLLEPIRPNGEYFDGDGLRAGWVTSTESVSIPDYRWGDTGQHVSFSYYTPEYQRTIDTVENLMDTLMPVTQTGDPSADLRFDRVYGYEGSGRP